jgi:hypothetical protein
VAKAASLAGGAKMKGVSTIAAGMIALSTHAPALKKAGTAVTTLGKRLPLLSIAFAGLDFAAKKASGQSTAQAAAGAGGGLVGGMAGAAIGSAVLPGVGTVAGGVLGSFIGEWIGSNIGPALSALPGQLAGMWSGFTQWLQNLPYNLGFAIGSAITMLTSTWNRLVAWFNGLGPWFSTMTTRVLSSLRGAWSMFVNGVKAIFSGGIDWGALKAKLGQALTGMISGAIDWAKGAAGRFMQGLRAGQVAAKPQDAVNPLFARAFGGQGAKFTNLGQAINYEMANKPKGSDLVIANSSETIIPAADGLGSMKGVIDAIWRSGSQVAATTMKGFDELRNTIAIGDAKNASATVRTGSMTKAAIDRSIAVSVAGDAKILGAIKAASAAGGFGADMGGALGGASGNLQAAAGLAKGMGLTMTSYKRSGPPNASYHNVGRAMDFSNSTGPTPQMMQFAQTLAAKYGSSISELIYTPLNYSIKNGKKVAPFAQAAHYNHVHVAFAHGFSNPRLFTSARAAAAYEGMMAPAGAQVLQAKTTTLNSSELGSKNVTVHQNISIDGAQDPRKLAEMVFNYAAQAAEHINNSSFA